LTYGGAPRVWNYSWTHFGNEKRSAFNLRKQTRTLGKEMRAFGCAALFAATGRTRAYIYTYE